MTTDARAACLLGSLMLACGAGRTPLATPALEQGSAVVTSPQSSPPVELPVAGQCRDGLTPCGIGDALRCHDVSRSAQHCGACGHACALGLGCDNGTCQQHRCKGGLAFKALALTRTVNPDDTGAYTSFGPALGDFDGDGNLDIVSMPAFDVPMSLFYGAGNGTFPTRQVIDTAAVRDWQVAAADVDGDGLLDLASIVNDDLFRRDDQPAEVIVRRGTGNRDTPFDKITDYPTISSVTSVLFADLDADGHPDLLAGVYRAVAYWRGQAGGHFDPQPSLDARDTDTIWPSPLQVADWNSDGILDIVHGPDSLRYWLGRGDGGFDSAIGCALAVGQLGDVDGDGRSDLVNRTGLLLGLDGCHASRIVPIADWSKVGGGVALADLDGDGDLDLVADLGKDVTVYVGDGTGGFTQTVSMPGSDRDWASGSFLFGDLNRDGKLDIVVVRTDGWRVLLNTCS